MTVVGTNKDLCKACYSCVRNCPVNAVKVEMGQSRIVDEFCINCGNCLRVCSQGAKVTDVQVEHVNEMINNGEKVVALVDSSYPVSFPEPDTLFENMKEYGFYDIYNASEGMKLVDVKYLDLLNSKNGGTIISSFCPSIVELIEKKYPNLLPNLAHIDSPVFALGRYLKKQYPKIKIVYIGPCVARKQEREMYGNDAVDRVLTFPELKQILGYENKRRDNIFEMSEFLKTEGKAAINSSEMLSLPGGFAKYLKTGDNLLKPEETLVIAGKEESIHFLNSLSKGMGIKPRFVDIYFCRGCIDGPLIDSLYDYYSRKPVYLSYVRNNETKKIKIDKKVAVKLDFVREYSKRQKLLPDPSEDEIRAILRHTFKKNEDFELNCGLCGYETCRERAIAVYHGLAEIDMCLPYLISQSRGEFEYYKNQFDSNLTATARATGLVGSSRAMKNLRNLVAKVSQNEATVLLLGESGVGKEVVAKAIHLLSGRKKEPFVGINCAALPDLLLESELFGYEDGAFTGAKKGGKEGRFELANGGTILLDEIGDLPLAMQAKLLRVLQEKEYTRLGGTINIPLNARIIAATNKDLRKMVSEGKFRADLFYRLNVISIQVPSLRERKDDIPPLMGHFLHKIAADKAIPPKIFSDEALNIMLKYDWPGNIRELENVIERLIYVSEGNVIRAQDLPAHIRQGIGAMTEKGIRPLKIAVQDLEKEMIKKALHASGNNKVKAAGMLGLPRATFYQKLKEYALM